MKCRSLKNWWNHLTQRDKGGEENAPSSETRVRMAPLTVGFRVDMWIPTGTGPKAQSSQLIWVSPAGSPRSVKALRVLVSPN